MPIPKFLKKLYATLKNTAKRTNKTYRTERTHNIGQKYKNLVGTLTQKHNHVKQLISQAENKENYINAKRYKTVKKMIENKIKKEGTNTWRKPLRIILEEQRAKDLIENDESNEIRKEKLKKIINEELNEIGNDKKFTIQKVNFKIKGPLSAKAASGRRSQSRS